MLSLVLEQGMGFIKEFAENLILRLMEDPKERDRKFREHLYNLKDRCQKTKEMWSLPLRPYGFWTFDRHNAQIFWDSQISQVPGRRDPYDDLLQDPNVHTSTSFSPKWFVSFFLFLNVVILEYGHPHFFRRLKCYILCWYIFSSYVIVETLFSVWRIKSCFDADYSELFLFRRPRYSVFFFCRLYVETHSFRTPQVRYILW